MEVSFEKNSAVHAMIVFRQAARTVELQVGDSIRAAGLTQTQFGILDVLYCKGDMAICDLKKKTLVTAGNMTFVLKNMERKGWLTRKSVAEDKRRHVFSITEQGKRLYEHVLPLHRQEIEEFFSILSPTERKQLISILKKCKKYDTEEFSR